MWHPMLAETESNIRVRSAICELDKALYQQNLLCFGANQESISRIEAAIKLLKEI